MSLHVINCGCINVTEKVLILPFIKGKKSLMNNFLGILSLVKFQTLCEQEVVVLQM